MTDSHADDDERIEKTIDDFRDRMRALELLVETQLKHARDNQNREKQTLFNSVREAQEHLEKQLQTIESSGVKNLNASDYGHAAAIIIDNARNLESLCKYSHEDLLSEVFFVSVFSGFDAYLHYLLNELYNRRPNLLNKLENKLVSFADVLSRPKDEIVGELIEKDIDSLLRESYNTIFDKLAKRFDIKTLKGIENWRTFIELSQRRHVITHCDGVMNNQYLANCKVAGIAVDPAGLGKKLPISKDYLLKGIEVVAEVGLKLGQVLWRASSERSTGAADAHLGDLIYELLKQEKWTLALWMGEFGQAVGRRKHKKPRSELHMKIILINHAQAAKWSGDKETAMKLVDGIDWSGSATEFEMFHLQWHNPIGWLRSLVVFQGRRELLQG